MFNGLRSTFTSIFAPLACLSINARVQRSLGGHRRKILEKNLNMSIKDNKNNRNNVKKNRQNLFLLSKKISECNAKKMSVLT